MKDTADQLLCMLSGKETHISESSRQEVQRWETGQK